MFILQLLELFLILEKVEVSNNADIMNNVVFNYHENFENFF